MSWDWLSRNGDLILSALRQHVEVTAAALAIAVVVALPIGLAGHRWRRAWPPILAATQVAYTIPSLALFVLLIDVFGIGEPPVIVGLALYALVILSRNLVEGLRTVGPEVTDAANAMGYRPSTRLLAVELPLAVPVFIAGLRVATVSTISLVSVGALVGTGGLGQLFIEGFQIDNPIEVWTGIVLTIVLALVADLLILGLGRLLTPWARTVR